MTPTLCAARPGPKAASRPALCKSVTFAPTMQVPKAGKFCGLYKHSGARAIIDRRGTLVVRPSPLELNLRPGGGRACSCSRAPDPACAQRSC